MILQVPTDTAEGGTNWDALSTQDIRITDARQHQKMR
jgi:hypothetical protein